MPYISMSVYSCSSPAQTRKPSNVNCNGEIKQNTGYQEPATPHQIYQDGSVFVHKIIYYFSY